MEDPLIHLITQSATINDTSSLKEFICLQSKDSLNIDDNTMHCLQSIVRDGTNKMNRVQCVLSCIKYFYEQNLNKHIWDKLANKFAELCVMCLNECVVLNKKYDKVENVLVYLSEVVSELLKQSELIVKTIHYLMVPPLIRIITTENFSFEAKLSLVRILSYIIKCSTKDDHSQINPHFQKDIANLANWILMCGDFETQTIILESLLYFLSGIDNQEEFCAEWFNLYPRIKTDFFNRDFSDFEPESRQFLNLVNKLNKKPQVYSLGCICVFSDGTKLQKPNDSNYLVFWVDFNIHSESVFIYFQGTDEMWEIFQIHNKNVSEVCSNSSEHYLNNQMRPIVKLCFNISCVNTDLTAKYVEIWFEISEDFNNLENSFLIPVYGFRYLSNWKASMSNSILSNEVMSSEISCSVDRNICSRKYTPLSVVIIPRNCTPNNESSQNLKSLQTIFNQSQLDSNVSRQSEHRKILESNHNIMEPDTLNSDESSCDEIKCTPDIAPVKNRKKILLEIQENKTNVLSPRHNQSSYKDGKKKQIIQSFSNNEKKVSQDNHDKEIKTNKQSVKKNNEKEISQDYHDKEIKTLKQLVKNINEKEVSQDNHDKEIKTHKQSVKKINEKKVSQDNRDKEIKTHKQSVKKINEKEVSQDNRDKEIKTLKDSVKKINKKEVSPEIHNKENEMNIKSITSSPKTRNEKTVNLKNSEKNKLSDIHLLKKKKSVKENELKNNVSLKRRKLFHSPDNFEQYSLNSPLYDCSQNTEQNENQQMTYRSENVMPKVTYSYRKCMQSKLASRDVWDFESETEFLITQQERNIKKFTTKKNSPKAQSTGNKRFFTKEQSAAIGLSVYQTPNIFSSKTKSIYSDDFSSEIKPVEKTYLKQPRKRKNIKLTFKNEYQNEKNLDEFYSDNEVQDMEISTILNPAMLINKTKFDADCFSPKPTYHARKGEKALLLKEEHLSRFGKLILKNLAKNIEESKIIIKNEREEICTKFISDMEALKKSTTSISVELNKCKKVLDKTNNEIEKTIKHFAKCTSNQMPKYFALVTKYAKDFESEMGEFAKEYVKNTKK